MFQREQKERGYGHQEDAKQKKKIHIKENLSETDSEILVPFRTELEKEQKAIDQLQIVPSLAETTNAVNAEYPA